MKREYLKNIKSENRIDRIRLIMPNDPVIGGQPSDNADDFTSNTPLLDIASTMKFAIDSINKTESNANNRLEKNKNLSDLQNKTTARSNLGLGTSATLNTTSTLSDRTDQVAVPKMVNDVNRAASTAQKTANNAHALAQTKQDKLTFVGDGKVMKEGAFGLGGNVVQNKIETIEKYAQQSSGLKFTYFDRDIPSDVPEEAGSAIKVLTFGHENWYTALVFSAYSDRVFSLSRNAYSGSQKKAVEFLTDRNTTTDKSGFLRTGGTANALVDSDVTNSFGNSKSLVASQALVNSLAQKIDDVPVDKIFTFDSAIPPKGYIARNGQAIDKNTMPKLYARYGANMPDDRDRVHRMAGSLAGIAGSTQEDAMQKITGRFETVYPSSSGAFTTKEMRGRSSLEGSIYKDYIVSLDSSLTTRTSTETRAKSRISIFCNKIQ